MKRNGRPKASRWPGRPLELGDRRHPMKIAGLAELAAIGAIDRMKDYLGE